MQPDAALDAYVEAALTVNAIPVAPEWLAQIRFNLVIGLRHARAVDAFALPDEAEPAAIFSA